MNVTENVVVIPKRFVILLFVAMFSAVAGADSPRKRKGINDNSVESVKTVKSEGASSPDDNSIESVIKENEIILPDADNGSNNNIGVLPLQTKQEMELSVKQRTWFRNPDGSCVQCSIGMCGVHTNTPEATTLLWDTQYGPRVRGGSGPSRVAGYMNERKIKGWNITGQQTWDWMKWSSKTGRFAAIGAGGSHFQTLYGWDSKTNKYYVCNNNSPGRIDEYNEADFRQLHLASGQWCVILEKSAPQNPEYVNWWKDDSPRVRNDDERPRHITPVTPNED